MSLRERLAGFFGQREERRLTSWDLLRGGAINLESGPVSPRVAENLSTVLACVGAISSAMASLPAFVYRAGDKGRSIDTGHPVARLVAAGPNEHQTWCDFIEWLMASVLLRGNALAQVLTDTRGAVVELRPIPWEWVSVQLLPSGRLVYDVAEATPIYGATGARRRLLQDDVLHLRDRTDDGLIGRSRLQRAASVVKAGISIQQFANSLYDNGVNPSGSLKTEAKLNPEQREALRAALQRLYAGPSGAAKTLILDQGLSWERISINPEDAEFLASRRFTVEELARLYGCPPPIIGDLSHGTFTNTETVGRWFAQHTLAPWIRKLESEFTRSVFSAASRATHRLELDMSGFLRGDPSSRWAAWKVAVEAGILDADEVREEEGFNPRGAAPAPRQEPASERASTSNEASRAPLQLQINAYPRETVEILERDDRGEIARIVRRAKE